MGKKIGILTFHYAINYGALLQAYALSRACEKLGFDVELINYYNHRHERANNIIYDAKRSFLKNIAYTFLVAPHYLQLKRKYKSFLMFKREYLNLTRRFETASDLIQNIPAKDFYISGSDQVFNPAFDENIMVYYQSFLKQPGTKKIAYAPSFGISVFDDSLRERLFDLLNDFDNLSCRENDGAEFLSRLTGKNVKIVLDPVFLLDEEEWGNIESDNEYIHKHEKGYIFVYDLNGRDNLISISKKLQQKVNLPIVCLTTKKYLIGKYHVEDIIINAGPRDFLSLIHNATYVITDSFHGIAFSIIFQKQFLAYNALPKASQRIKSLLGLINLKERIIDTANADEECIWQIISQKLDCQSELREYINLSVSYLNESLS